MNDNPVDELFELSAADSLVEKERAWWTLKHWFNQPKNDKPPFEPFFAIGRPVFHNKSEEIGRVIGRWWDDSKAMWVYAIQRLKDIQTCENRFVLWRESVILPYVCYSPKFMCIKS